MAAPPGDPDEYKGEYKGEHKDDDEEDDEDDEEEDDEKVGEPMETALRPPVMSERSSRDSWGGKAPTDAPDAPDE